MNGMDMLTPLGFASGLLGFLFMFFVGLLSLLVPFFVWRIWKWSYTSSRQLEQLNVKLDRLLEVMAGSIQPFQQPAPPTEKADVETTSPAPGEAEGEDFEFSPLDEPGTKAVPPSTPPSAAETDSDSPILGLAEEQEAGLPGSEEDMEDFSAAFGPAEIDEDLSFGEGGLEEGKTFREESGDWVSPPEPEGKTEWPAAEEEPARPGEDQETRNEGFAPEPGPLAPAGEETATEPTAPAEEPPPEEPLEEPRDVIPLPPDPNRPDTRLARCGGCGHKLAYKEALAGKRVKCPACKKIFVLP